MDKYYHLYPRGTRYATPAVRGALNKIVNQYRLPLRWHLFEEFYKERINTNWRPHAFFFISYIHPYGTVDWVVNRRDPIIEQYDPIDYTRFTKGLNYNVNGQQYPSVMQISTKHNASGLTDQGERLLRTLMRQVLSAYLPDTHMGKTDEQLAHEAKLRKYNHQQKGTMYHG